MRMWASGSPVARAVRVSLAIITLLLAVALGLGGSSHVRASGSFDWTNYDITLTLNQDGSYHVVERQEIDFYSGTFQGGYATIPLARTEGIENISVGEIESGSTALTPYNEMSWDSFDDNPNAFATQTTSSDVNVAWGFPETTDQPRTFVLSYDVLGALRVYTDPPNQQIWWTAIASDVTKTAPVENASMTIILPQAVDPTTTKLDADSTINPKNHTNDGKTWTWTAANLTDGDSFEVRLQFPPIVDATAPSWQAADDAQRQTQEKKTEHDAFLKVIFLGIALLTAMVGGIGLYALWYTRGRDPHVGLVAQFLAQPPDNLPPGAVGVLVDEVADERDLVATVADLARRGVLKTNQFQSSTTGAGSDFSFTLVDPKLATAPFEKTLLDALFGSEPQAGATANLSQVSRNFDRAVEKIKSELYQELVTRGYFRADPAATRAHWRRTGKILLGLVIAAGIIGLIFASGAGWFLLFAVIVGVIVALGLMKLSRSLPRKTNEGAEAAAKWRAFRTYLRDINKYAKLDESREIFDRFLAYAIAFGLQEGWVARFEAAGAPAPVWYDSSMPGGGGWSGGGGYYGGRRRGGGPIIFWGGSGSSGGGGNSGGGGGGGVNVPNIPNLQDASNQAGKSLQHTSAGFFDLLNEAGKAFGSYSGGGGHHGSWGGGGGGFGGGGSHGGSSGGGGRGFH